MRKTFALFMMVGLLFSLLTACGVTTTNPTSTTTQATIATTTATNKTATPTPPLALHKGTLAQVFPQLANLSDTATSIDVKYYWDGMTTSFAPITTTFKLQRKGNQFEGTGYFDIQYDYQQPFSSTANIVIPSSHSQAFLQALTQIPLEEGEYKPYMGYTDDYPTTTIDIQLASGEKLEVYTRSQNNLNQNDKEHAGYVPWAVYFEGRTFVVNTDAAYQAYQNIYPDLQIGEQIKKLEQSAEPNNGPLDKVLLDLANLPSITTSITAEYSYATLGISLTTQIVLKYKDNKFEGVGHYNYWESRLNAQVLSSTTKISIPTDHAQKFLQALTQIPLVEGEYKPFIEHTDDIPVTTLEIELISGETLKVYTSSQNSSDKSQKDKQAYVPWAVEFQGRTFVVNTDAAYQAYQNIYPDLQIDEQIKKLEQTVSTTPQIGTGGN